MLMTPVCFNSSARSRSTHMLKLDGHVIVGRLAHLSITHLLCVVLECPLSVCQ